MGPWPEPVAKPKRVTVFVPLHDTNPLKSIDYQYVTVSLIVLNIAIYLIFQTGWFIPLDEENLAAFAAIPAELMGHGLGDETILSPFLVPDRFTLVTYMFLHGS